MKKFAWMGWLVKGSNALKKQGIDGLCRHGECEIVIGNHAKGKNRMATFIHEALHRVRPDWSEEEVMRGEILITDLLWQAGYRQNKKGG